MKIFLLDAVVGQTARHFYREVWIAVFCGFCVCLFPVSILNECYWRSTFAVNFDQLLQLLSSQSALHTKEKLSFQKIGALYAKLSEMKEDTRRNSFLHFTQRHTHRIMLQKSSVSESTFTSLRYYEIYTVPRSCG